MRPRAPPPSSAPRFAPVVPLPPTAQRHHLRRSVIRRSSSQSGSSIFDSDLDESDEEAAESSPHGDSDADSDDDSDDPQSGASLSSRSTSRSSLSDSDNSSSEDDGLSKIRIRDGSSSTIMSVPRGGAFCQNDNLGVLALMVPITGVSTMVLTEVLACVNHFDCSKEYPTLSYAAEFKPEGHAFTVGMCTTSLFIQATVLLFHWFMRLKLFHPGANLSTVVVTHLCLVAGTIAATSLFGLAVFDMGAYHDIHVNFTVLFFLSAWVMMIAMQIARRNLLRDQDETRPQKKKSLPNDGASAVCLALQRWKHVSLRRAYQLGNGFLGAGLTSTALFGLLYQCVNGKWANPLGFTAVQEALLEAFAILCQLFFMGTLSCELAKLTRVVEHRDYDELERAE